MKEIKNTKELELANRSMKEEWEFYKKSVISKEASEVQIKVMRESFFAGSWVAQTKMIAIAGAIENDEIAETRVAELHEEAVGEIKKGMRV